MRGIGLERQVAELVDDQKFRLGKSELPILEVLLGVRFGE